MSTAQAHDWRADQQLSALERANEIRLARAELRRKLARGEIFAAAVLLEQPEEARTWPVGDLIARQRRWGSTTCRRLLARLQIPETKPIEALTDRQRAVLVQALRRPPRR